MPAIHDSKASVSLSLCDLSAAFDLGDSSFRYHLSFGLWLQCSCFPSYLAGHCFCLLQVRLLLSPLKVPLDMFSMPGAPPTHTPSQHLLAKDVCPFIQQTLSTCDGSRPDLESWGDT